MNEEITSLWFRQREHISGHITQMFLNGKACQVSDDFILTTKNHWYSSFLVRSNCLSRNHDRNHTLRNSKHYIRHLFHILDLNNLLSSITLMSLFYLTNFYFLSIELDVVMETDNELEQKHELDHVRFFIWNWKLRQWVVIKHLKYLFS